MIENMMPVIISVSSLYKFHSLSALRLASFLDLFLGLLLLELGEGLVVVRDKVHAAHEGLEDSGDAETGLGLVVLQDAAHGSLGGAEGGVQHVHVDLILASLLLTKLESDIKSS